MSAETQLPALFLSAESPYPLHGGGAFRSASLLNYFGRTREVDLVVFRQPGDPDPRAALPPGLVRHCAVIDLPPTGRSAASRVVRNARRLARRVPPLIDRFSGFENLIEESLDGRRYGVGVVEHLWCARYVDVLSRFCETTVLDLHNIESALHRRCADVERGALGFAHSVFANAARSLEREWLPRYSRVLAASRHDADLAREIAPGACVSVYPNAIPHRPMISPARKDNVILFTGNMEYHPNISAVRYFSRDVWPRIRERWPGLVWRLVGRNPEAVREYCEGDSIEIRGAVPDALEELARARVAVVPVLAGSGTRVKVLEAWAAGAPVVSTKIGVEGLPAVDGENVLIANASGDFVDAVSRLLGSPALGAKLASAGRNLIEKGFTWEAAWKTLNI